MVPGLFSVVVPVFDAGPVLERAVDSVRAQTYDRYEIILVDDGSRDGSDRRARELAATDERITALAVPRSGAPARPRNQGIRASRGEFVAFLDQDDWWLPEKLERQYEKFRAGDDAVVYTDIVFVDRASPESGRRMSELDYYRKRTGDMPEGSVEREIIRSNFTAQFTVAVRADWVQRVGPMNEDAPGVDCYEYLLRLALAGGRFGAVREVCGVYERQEDSFSRDQLRAWEASLPFFRTLAAEHPEFAEEWEPRIREYEQALARGYLARARDPEVTLRERVTAMRRMRGVNPPARYTRKALRSFLPRRAGAPGGAG